MLFLEFPSIYSYPGIPSIEQTLIKERQLEDRSFRVWHASFSWEKV